MQEKKNYMISQYANSQVDYGEIQQGVGEDDILNVKTVNTAELEAKKEYEKLKEKLKIFESIETIKEAKVKAKEMFGIKDDISFLKIGNAFITIQNQAKFFRITVNSKEELVCYNFSRES